MVNNIEVQYGLIGAISQQEFDNLNNDFKMLRFTNSLEEMKSNHALLLAQMRFHVGTACGLINAVKALIDGHMTETAKTLYHMVESQIVEAINAANHAHRDIVESSTDLGQLENAYINHLAKTSGDTDPLHIQVNKCNELLKSILNLLTSFDQMFDIRRG